MIASPATKQFAPVLPRLRPDQYRIATHQAKRKLVNTGRRWGKTTMGLCLVVMAAWLGARVAWITPQYRNGAPLWRALEWCLRHLKGSEYVRINKAERTVEFPKTGGFIGMYTAESIDAMRGEYFHLAVLDESARIKEDAWTEVIEPTLADVDGDAIFISTPAGKNWFYRMWQQARARMDASMAAWTAPSSDNPNPNIKQAYELAKTRVPERVWRQEWNAEFVDDAWDIWLRQWFDGQNRYDAFRQDLDDFTVGRYLSFDTAMKDKETSAYTACVVADLTSNYKLRIRYVWRDKLAFPRLIAEMERLATSWDYDKKLKGVLIEDQSSGTSAFQTLRAAAEPWLSQKLIAYRPKGSKEVRAEQAAVWGRLGCVKLPYHTQQTPWLPVFEDEIFEFPNVEFKDQTDALSQIVLWLEHYLAAGYQQPLPTADLEMLGGKVVGEVA